MANPVHNSVEIHSSYCRHRDIGMPENVRAFDFGNAGFLAEANGPVVDKAAGVRRAVIPAKDKIGIMIVRYFLPELQPGLGLADFVFFNICSSSSSTSMTRMDFFVFGGVKAYSLML